jgi:hypothetical protein
MLAETVVKDSCTWLNPVPEFFLASLDWFNDYAEIQETWPVCLMENVTPSEPRITSQGVTEQLYNITLFFLHNYPAGDGEDVNHNPQIGTPRHTAVDTMRRLAEDLLQTLFRDTRIFKASEDVTGAVIRSVYNFMDMNLDGVQLTFKLRLGISFACVDKHDGPQA